MYAAFAVALEQSLRDTSKITSCKQKYMNNNNNKNKDDQKKPKAKKHRDKEREKQEALFLEKSF